MGQSPEKQNLPRASHPGLSQQLGERGASTIQTAGGQIRGFPKANSSLVPGSFVLGKWSLRAQGPGQAGASLPRRLGLCYQDQLPLPPVSLLLPPPLFQAWVLSLSGAISAGSTPASSPSPASVDPPPLAPAACLSMPLARSRRHATGSS